MAGDASRVGLAVTQKAARKAEYGEVRWDVAISSQRDELVAVYELPALDATAEGAALAGSTEKDEALARSNGEGFGSVASR